MPACALGASRRPCARRAAMARRPASCRSSGTERPALCRPAPGPEPSGPLTCKVMGRAAFQRKRKPGGGRARSEPRRGAGRQGAWPQHCPAAPSQAGTGGGGGLRGRPCGGHVSAREAPGCSRTARSGSHRCSLVLSAIYPPRSQIRYVQVSGRRGAGVRAASPVPLPLPGRPRASGHTRAPGTRETPSDAILARRVKGTPAPRAHLRGGGGGWPWRR